MQPLFVSAYTLVSALGVGVDPTFEALRNGRSGLTPCDFLDANLDTWIGRVPGIEAQELPPQLVHFDCRNNRLAHRALTQDRFDDAVVDAVRRYGSHRIGVVVGTSTSGILETELGYRCRDVATGALPEGFSYQFAHNTYSVADFTRRFLGVSGPAFAVSTACSSSAKAFASAQRLIAAGLCDAVVVGGVDSLCFTTLCGFSSLELVSKRPCRPADQNRDGISIGEAAGFALVEKEGKADDVCLLGHGESTDAYHMSSPHPEGLGAQLAMSAALKRAGLAASDIDYVNLHGTATRANDLAEDKAVCAVIGSDTPVSSIKGWTGHTLGAAGIANAVVSCLSITRSFVPRSLNTEQVDAELHANIVLESKSVPVRNVISNAFGFGGNNVSLVFGRAKP
jgi:3-oxoacyl-[acyl-carrier-protein] synthase-1